MNRLTPGEGSKAGSMLPGLARYGSAPGSLLSGIATSVINGGGEFPAVGSDPAVMSRFFSGETSCLTSAESSCRPGAGSGHRPYVPGEIHVAAGDLGGSHRMGGGVPLVRHSSSPPGLLAHIMVDHHGLSGTREIGNYLQAGTDVANAIASRRLTSQWSFSRDSLSQISEMSIPDVGENGNSSDEAAGHVGQSYISSDFPVSSWDDTNSVMFSAPFSKRAKDHNGEVTTTLHSMDSQIGLPNTSLEISNMEKYLQMSHDSVTCKVRAKRGCATHPRSIAERERRTRISKRLRKLQDLVPNMDKQTNTSDMLDLAAQHITDLQAQLQNLKEEQENCICSCKKV
ncbi:transcription factor bHLH128-like [Typha angustifolia]|uniref:transcription factor bHLH128-like n=1 Tax=Typha angustifolia TaxID=59011 RepID=UPI003C30A897